MANQSHSPSSSGRSRSNPIIGTLAGFGATSCPIAIAIRSEITIACGDFSSGLRATNKWLVDGDRLTPSRIPRASALSRVGDDSPVPDYRRRKSQRGRRFDLDAEVLLRAAIPAEQSLPVALLASNCSKGQGTLATRAHRFGLRWGSEIDRLSVRKNLAIKAH